jgi:FtsH-binding integral membrane protein
MYMNLTRRFYDKRWFLSFVFLTLIFQLGITYNVLNQTANPPPPSNIFGLFIVALSIIVILSFIQMPEIAKFGLFSVFSYIQGLILSVYKRNYNPEVINTAIKGTMSIFATMFAAGLGITALGIELGEKIGAFLFWVLLTLILLRLVFMSAIGMTHKILSFVGLLLFAMYVVYDTNTILQRNYNGGVISAALDYYLDILNLFSSQMRTQN